MKAGKIVKRNRERGIIRGNPAQVLVAAVLLFAPMLAACLPGPQPVIPDPVDPEPVEPTKEVGCAQVCDRMRELDCLAAEPTPNGATCEDVCENVQESGFLSWDLECRYRAATCDEADSCED